jgi:transcriptional regulator with XRE-family HTH domain
MTVGERVKRLRMERGGSQTLRARQLEVNPKQVSRWERGAHTPITGALIRIAEILGVWLDHPTFNSREATRHADIANLELREKVQEIGWLPADDKVTDKAVLGPFFPESRSRRLAFATE